MSSPTSATTLSGVLFDRLNTSGVNYCHWKSNINLDKSLSGETDLDLLVARKDIPAFVGTIAELGFKALRPRGWGLYPAMEDYIGLDEESGRLLHLHVHYQVILGEANVKSYCIPVESMLLEGQHTQLGVRVPAPEAELFVYLLRLAAKSSRVPSTKSAAQILRPPATKEKGSEWSELEYLRDRADAAAFRELDVSDAYYYDVNVNGTRHVLEAAEKNNVKKVIYCSTQGVHGNVDHPPGNEDTPIEPEDYYQLTKYEGEKVADEFIKEGMDITTLRPTAIYGPGDPGRFLMLFRRVKKGMFPFFGNGQALYHPLYIENFVDAFELAAEKPEGKGRVYLIADDQYYHIKDIVVMIGKIMGGNLKIRHFPFWPLYAVAATVELLFKPLPWDPPIFRRRADWFRQNRAFKIDKARTELGYDPKVGLKEGLTATYEWYRDNGYL